MLGIQPSTDASQDFMPLGELNGPDNTDLTKVMTEPWSADKFPGFAEWIKLNGKALALINGGTLILVAIFLGLNTVMAIRNNELQITGITNTLMRFDAFFGRQDFDDADYFRIWIPFL